MSEPPTPIEAPPPRRADLTDDPLARGFELGPDGGPGCLLVHGLTGSPDELRPVGERLASKGWTVVAPCLPGHGTRVEDLLDVSWPLWFESVLTAWTRLAARTACDRFVAGLSMGALLSLHLARLRPEEVRAVAALAPALELSNQKHAEGAVWLDRLFWLPRRYAIVSKGPAERRSPAYDAITVRAVASLIRLQRVVRAELPAITTPTLVLEGGLDKTVSKRAGAVLEEALGSTQKSRLLFENARHVITEGVDAVAVVDAVEHFFQGILDDRDALPASRTATASSTATGR